jgi:hypothetical protein
LRFSPLEASEREKTQFLQANSFSSDFTQKTLLLRKPGRHQAVRIAVPCGYTKVLPIRSSNCFCSAVLA